MSAPYPIPGAPRTPGPWVSSLDAAANTLRNAVVCSAVWPSNDWVKPPSSQSSSSRAIRGAVGVESGGVVTRESAMEIHGRERSAGREER